jgi:hypothetical protein
VRVQTGRFSVFAAIFVKASFSKRLWRGGDAGVKNVWFEWSLANPDWLSQQ